MSLNTIVKKVSGAIGSTVINRFNPVMKNSTGFFLTFKKCSIIFVGDFEDDKQMLILNLNMPRLHL